MTPTIERPAGCVLEECDGMEREPSESRGIIDPGAGRAMFSLSHLDPHPDLADHVERHWIVRWSLPEGEPFTQAILPHPCVNLSSEPGLVAVYGIPLERSLHRIEGSGLVVGTKFRPGGFSAFSSTPVSLLNDRIVPLGEALGEPGARLQSELEELAGEVEAHVDAVEGFLLGRLPGPDPRYELVRAVVSDMLVVPPATTVAELADRHSVSPRTLQRAFNEHVGVSPKWVLKRYRMHEAAERIARGEGDDLAALALDLGYFDQPHFTSDFSAQIGRSPAEYARACALAAGRPEPALAGG